MYTVDCQQKGKEVREMATIETLKKEIEQMKKNLKEAEAKLAAIACVCGNKGGYNIKNICEFCGRTRPPPA